MIVKVQEFKPELVGVYEEQIYSNVETINRFRDVNEDEFIELFIKGKEMPVLIQITHFDENGNHPSLIGAMWLMNNEGKTIERLV